MSLGSKTGLRSNAQLGSAHLARCDTIESSPDHAVILGPVTERYMMRLSSLFMKGMAGRSGER